MKTLSTLIAGALLSATVCAQGVITRLNSGQSYFYYDGDIQAVLDLAATEAGTDTIILGGGAYIVANGQDLIVNSKIVLVGSGILPDSSVYYGGRTVIQPGAGLGLRFLPGSDGSELHGIVFEPTAGSAYIRLGTGTLPSTAVNNILVKRCSAFQVLLGHQNQSLAQGARIEECVLDNVNLSGALGTQVSNCYLLNGVVAGTVASGCEMRNNVFFDWVPAGGAGNIYRDNIFLKNNNSNLTINEASTFENNLYVGNGPGFVVVYGGNVLSSNDLPAETAMADALVNVPVPFGYDNFSFENDYHVTPLYAASGSDGSAVGTYGGPSPFKEGSIPFNPHWTELNGPASSNNGILQNVIIRGSAQTH